MTRESKSTPGARQVWVSLALVIATIYLLPTGIIGSAQDAPAAILFLVGGVLSALGLIVVLSRQAAQRRRARNMVLTWADRESFELDEDRRRGREEELKTNTVIAMSQGNKLGGNQHGSGLPDRWT